ncbi:serine/threonine-protein kinase [Streptomyces sp. NPDC055105]|uniref:serine/threonine-protein kinase n=1 Tax=Streptomyces sp. NPDC055105 TaxID=3365719 RepID=UPI0037D30838
MSNDGGPAYGPNDPTSFGLRPPQQPHTPQQGNPYAQEPPAPQQPPTAYPQPQPSHQPPPTQVVPPRQSTESEPGAGRLIGGRYRLLSKLGHGGMGTVWRAKDETVDREVAVKEPRVPDHLPERERTTVFERMRREARAAARLDHPAVVNVHDVAVEDGQPWIVMEFVQGRTLGDALQEGTLGARDAARIGLEVLGALEAAHAAGVLHRDVKPDNVMLGRHDRVVLTDFGIAQIEGETNLTDTGGFVGSPEFIAPERVLGQRPGPASDLWSLGVVLYAATEGVSPFRRNNTPATLQSVINATPAAPAAARGPLAEAINGLLAKDPARRPNAARVRDLLERAANPPEQPRTQVVQLAGPGGEGVSLSRKALLGVGAAVVAAAVVAYLVIADPFAGPLPDGWQDHQEGTLAATFAAPPEYVRFQADNSITKTDHWVSFRDPSYAVSITLSLTKQSEDSLNAIASSASAQAYKDSDEINKGDNSKMADKPAPHSRTAKTTYNDRESAENTITYTDDSDSDAPKPREAKVFYYKARSGNMYQLWIDYPGKGDFLDRGREVAKTAIANLDIQKL